MKTIKTPILPIHQTIVKVEGKHKLDLEAICMFAAIGFFFDTDTYWKDEKVLSPGTISTVNEKDELISSKKWFEWHYTPRAISFNDTLQEFTDLFETIIEEQTSNKKVILPISGGLDSRTQATALKHLEADIFSYSYEFQNGYSETKIAEQIASICDFDFQSFKIKEGYLWDKLDDLVNLNQCYSDFTSPRQMAIADEFSEMGDVFCLGHWGDVLFDSYNCKSMSHDEQAQFLSHKLLKRGGLEFASDLWQVWHLEGDFKTYFENRISKALNEIKITDTNARLRVFKSKYWASRWTSVNLSVFEKYRPIRLPYYDNRMCEFICSIPEKFLKDRQLQIAYVKKRSPELAKVTWQDKRPYNLNNYKNQNALKTLNYKIQNKIRRSLNSVLGKPYIQRNWELQFLGETNREQLEAVITKSNLKDFVSEDIIERYVSNFFRENDLQNAHTINMLLVLAKFNQNRINA